jgi:hypothetical protein
MEPPMMVGQDVLGVDTGGAEEDLHGLLVDDGDADVVVVGFVHGLVLGTRQVVLDD